MEWKYAYIQGIGMCEQTHGAIHPVDENSLTDEDRKGFIPELMFVDGVLESVRLSGDREVWGHDEVVSYNPWNAW
jgi:hypothetical protein